MNKDEIQPFTVPSGIRACCGLVMNKDEIQQNQFGDGVHPVVVW